MTERHAASAAPTASADKAARRQEPPGNAAAQLVGLQLQLLGPKAPTGHGGHRTQDHGRHVVGDQPGLRDHPLEQRRRPGVAVHAAHDVSQARPAQDAALGAGLGQAVGVEADRRPRGQGERGLAHAGAQPQAQRRRGNSQDRLGSRRTRDDRWWVTGAGVGQRPVARVVHGHHGGGELASHVFVDHAAADLQRGSRLQAGLEVGT